MPLLKQVNMKYFIPLHVNIRKIATQPHVQEVRIPLSPGHLAGKWWGPFDRRPIVAFHGWQDNCGSFDRLIPLLPEHIPVLALDAPGHGYSYKLPPGIPYRNSDAPIMIKQIFNYFGWDKITLMGHSLGAIISFMYGSLFPQDVDYLICLDGLHPLVHPKGMQVVPKNILDFIKYDTLQKSKQEPPSYTLEELEQRLHSATRKSIDLGTTKYILHRNITESKRYPGKYYFSRDSRLKVGPMEVLDPVQIVKSAEKITFPIFISKAKDSPFFGSEGLFKQVLPVVKRSSSDCQLHEVAGKHHVHLNEPEIVASLISEFINKYDSSDRNNDLKPEILYNENTNTQKVVTGLN